MKQVYLLPNLLTTGNLFCGVHSILSALNGRFITSAWFILAAIFFDFLDGQVARLKKATTRFGVEYDSLSDLVSFGLAPVMIIYLVFLKDMERLALWSVFVYVACTALRLARFNTQTATFEKTSFVGLPTPASAGVIASSIITIYNNNYSILASCHFAPFVVLLLSFLMVSTTRYPTIKTLNLWNKRPFRNLVLVILSGSVIMFFHIELFLLLCFLGYLITGFLKPRYWQKVVFSANHPRAEVQNEVV